MIYILILFATWITPVIRGRRIIIARNSSRPYMIRYYLIRTRWFAVHIHRILRPDDDEALHDHPWPFMAMPLIGSYHEVRPDAPPTVRRMFRPAFRSATDRHRISYVSPHLVTLFIRGRRVRNWGFWPNSGTFVPWEERLFRKAKESL
jgi:hypothetical protein